MRQSVIILFLVFTMTQFAFAVPETVSSVDLNKYIGAWYEVASIPQFFQRKCVANTVAEYSFDPSDKDLIVVMNSCQKENGESIHAEGRAKVEDATSRSKLKVTFVKIFNWIFSFGGNYWILKLADDYSYAVVGDPTLEYAWILSRSPQFDFQKFVELEKSMKSIGYDTCAILTSVQSSGLQKRMPLCEFVKVQN
jgi:apolipoprotein D and lipocalin family protein